MQYLTRSHLVWLFTMKILFDSMYHDGIVLCELAVYLMIFAKQYGNYFKLSVVKKLMWWCISARTWSVQQVCSIISFQNPLHLKKKKKKLKEEKKLC